MQLTGLTFADWLEHAFGHEVRLQAEPRLTRTRTVGTRQPAIALAHLTRVFEEPESASRWFADAQIAQGLTYLLSTSASGDNGWFYATSVPVAQRLRSIETEATLSGVVPVHSFETPICAYAAMGIRPS